MTSDDPSGRGWDEQDRPDPAAHDTPGSLSSHDATRTHGRRNVSVRGVVRGRQLRRDPNRAIGQDVLVLTFRVHTFDELGNLVGQTPVELRGRSITGDIHDGDHVQVNGRRSRDGLVRAKEVEVWSANSQMLLGIVRAKSIIAVWQVVVSVLIVLAFAGFVAFGVIRFSNLSDDSQLPPTTFPTLTVITPTLPTTTSTTPSETTSTPPTSSTPPEAVQISCAYDPSGGGGVEAGPDGRSTPGQEVRWVNTGTEQMSVDISPKPSDWDDSAAQQISPGETFAFAFVDQGTFQYTCVFPTSGKVSGQLIVETK